MTLPELKFCLDYPDVLYSSVIEREAEIVRILKQVRRLLDDELNSSFEPLEKLIADLEKRQ